MPRGQIEERLCHSAHKWPLESPGTFPYNLGYVYGAAQCVTSTPFLGPMGALKDDTGLCSAREGSCCLLAAAGLGLLWLCPPGHTSPAHPDYAQETPCSHLAGRGCPSSAHLAAHDIPVQGQQTHHVRKRTMKWCLQK